MAGPSPRVRGERSMFLAPSPPGRAIPACAGRTLANTNSSGVSSGHPRVCGENPLFAQNWAAAGWAIPACAGRTA